jgi:peptidoglycan/xylan/chitin deacetylase (PgdA/CDA1 family)
LTFDAGADRGHAERILDVLRSQRVEATFGVTGVWAKTNPDLVVRMARDGHQIIDHTWDHRSLAMLDGPAQQAELERAGRLLRRLTGQETRPYFRPPYGALNGGVLANASAAGYRYAVMWTVDSLGWEQLPASAVAARCLSRAAAGAIYLFHVGAQSQDAFALRRIIDGLRAQGFRFLTVADMLPARRRAVTGGATPP